MPSRVFHLRTLPPPVRELTKMLDDGRIIKAEVVSDKDGLEFFPKIKKRKDTPSTEGDEPMSVDDGSHEGDEEGEVGEALPIENGIARPADSDLDTNTRAQLEGYDEDDIDPTDPIPEPSLL